MTQRIPHRFHFVCINTTSLPKSVLTPSTRLLNFAAVFFLYSNWQPHLMLPLLTNRQTYFTHPCQKDHVAILSWYCWCVQAFSYKNSIIVTATKFRNSQTLLLLPLKTGRCSRTNLFCAAGTFLPCQRSLYSVQFAKPSKIWQYTLLLI